MLGQDSLAGFVNPLDREAVRALGPPANVMMSRRVVSEELWFVG